MKRMPALWSQSFEDLPAPDYADVLVWVVTAVELHNLRGRLYFRPVSLVHPLVVSAMLSSACRRLGGPAPGARAGS